MVAVLKAGMRGYVKSGRSGQGFIIEEPTREGQQVILLLCA